MDTFRAVFEFDSGPGSGEPAALCAGLGGGDVFEEARVFAGWIPVRQIELEKVHRLSIRGVELRPYPIGGAVNGPVR